MNRRLAGLAERRRLLVMRASEQRAALALAAAPWRARLAVVDRGIAVLSYVRQRPALIALGALLLVLRRPRRVGTWLQRGWLFWRIGQKLRRR
jgi:hypothetical protein